MNANNLLSVLTGANNDISSMVKRVKDGYDNKYSDHVQHYDELGYHLQEKAANYQLNGIDLTGLQILDVGCGTGALAEIALRNGAAEVVCGDISSFMLKIAQKKKLFQNPNFSCCQLDAGDLPYKDNAFDAVISGMSFGLFPDQEKAATEMVRITKPGGLVCIGAHGPEHYWEAIDASFRCVDKRYVLGYRFEWWPRSEEYIRALLERTCVKNIVSKRVIWRNKFEDGAAAYDFFAAISSSWWYSKFPPEKRMKEAQRTRDYFRRKKIDIVTDDIVVAYGYKA